MRYFNTIFNCSLKICGGISIASNASSPTAPGPDLLYFIAPITIIVIIAIIIIVSLTYIDAIHIYTTFILHIYILYSIPVVSLAKAF